ncbi:MAG TPA: glutathione S-transferase family protein [Methylocella sp.]|jgi:glutathione S-transferase
MMIELYVFLPSPRCFKPMAIANHLGLDWAPRIIDLTKGDQKTPQFAALNPNMRVPTMKDGNYILWESNAICQYLALQRPESGLMPKDDLVRIDVARWQFWDLAHWGPCCVPLIGEYVIKPHVMKTGEPDMAAVAKGTDLFHSAAKILDGELKGKQFVTGNTLTVADFSLGAMLNYAGMAHFPLEPYAEIRRWFATLSALPAWQKTVTQTALPAAIPA